MTGTQRETPWAAVWPFIACLAVVALSGARLALTIPHLFTDATPGQWGAATMLTIMVIGFGLLGRRLRPALAAPEQ